MNYNSEYFWKKKFFTALYNTIYKIFIHAIRKVLTKHKIKNAEKIIMEIVKEHSDSFKNFQKNFSTELIKQINNQA